MVTLHSLSRNVADWLRPAIEPPAEKDPAQIRRPLPVRRIAAQAAGMWLATRVALLLIMLLARAFGFTPLAPVPLSVFPANPQYAPLLLPLLAPHPILASWVHWDASWYLLIGIHGYDIFTADSTGFFPMYPLQIRLLTLLFGNAAVLPVALLLSNLASLAAFIGLGLLAAHEADPASASTNASARLIKVTAAYPFAFFLFAPFTEGFFLACVVFSFLCARRGHWRWATACAFLAGLTRPTAVALVPALAWEYGRQRGLWRRAAWRAAWRAGGWRTADRLRTLAKGIAVAAAVPLGLGCYLLFLGLRYGDPMTPFTAQDLYHGHQNWPVWQTLAELIGRFFSPPAWPPAAALLYLDGGILLIFLVITLLNIRRLPLLYTLYMLATLYLLLATPIPHRKEFIPSAGRYLLISVPVFLLFSRWIERWPWLEMVLVGGCFLLQGLFVVLFLNGLWIE